MKPVHIGLLVALGVVAGVLGTALFRPSQPPPAQAAPTVAHEVTPTPAAEPVAAAEPDKAAAPAPSPFPEKKPDAHKAARQHRPAGKEVAQNQPPAMPASSTPAPAPAAAPAPAPEPAPAPSAPVHNEPVVPPPPPPEPHKVTIPVGTLLSVRLGEGLSSERNHPGDTFSATLDQPLTVDGFVIAERGSRLQGKIVDVKESGRVKGLASIGISLTRLHTSDGQNVAITTDTFTKEAPKSVKQDVERGAAATGIGAVIGAIAGGGKGAAIGAGAGAAAGVGGAMITRGKPATIANETRLQFRLSDPVTLTEKLH